MIPRPAVGGARSGGVVGRRPALRPRSSAAWLRHFIDSAGRIEPVPWDLGPWLDRGEREAVTRSIQEFQLGESSEGRRLRALAVEHAVRTGDRAYATAIDRFIAEEQRHSRYLAQFLGLEGIPLVSRTPVDGIFRHLRRLAGLETMISVLITAEIIAQIYYWALGMATRSPVLRSICRRVLVDEAHHVRFQGERVARLRRHRSSAGRAVLHALHGALAAGACVVVWAGHRRVFARAGLGVTEVARAFQSAFRRGFRLMDPARYDWGVLGADRDEMDLGVGVEADRQIGEPDAPAHQEPPAGVELEVAAGKAPGQRAFRHQQREAAG